MYLTLDEYLTGARKIIVSKGYGNLIKDEDAVSFVAHYMMRADEVYNGMGTREGFRVNRAHFGIRNYLHKKKKNRELSIDPHELCIMRSKDRTPHSLFEQKDLIEKILSMKNLTQRQKDCLSMYYLNNCTLKEIGNVLGITKQGVQMSIYKAITKIRKKYHVLMD